VGIYRAHYIVASILHALYIIYLGYLYPSAAKYRITIPIHLNISEALSFNDLRTLAAFFREGPGYDIAILRNIRSLSISYLDNYTTIDWRRRTTDYTYKAFKLLYTS
jgi:hypothetical protein